MNKFRSFFVQSGFTIVELMITLLLAAVVLSFAVPSYRSMLDRNHLETATVETVNILRAARERAVGLEEEVSISQDSKSLTCSHASETTDNPCFSYEINYPEVSISADHSFRFTPTGFLVDDNPGPDVMTLTISHEDVSNHNFEIRIFGSGRISVKQVEI